MTKTELTIEGVRQLLGAQCSDAGSQKAWAEKAGVSEQYVSDVLAGRRDPGKTVLDALELVKVTRVTYLPAVLFT